MINKMHYLDQYNNDITNIEIVYEELSKFINKNIDAKICAKINDISSFISKSIEDLERIAKSKGFDKNEAYIKPELKPLTLNVDKAYEIIGKFNLISSKPSKKSPNLRPTQVPNMIQNTENNYYGNHHLQSAKVAQSQQYDAKEPQKSSFKPKTNEYDQIQQFKEDEFSTMGRHDYPVYYNNNGNSQIHNEIDYKSEFDHEIDADIGNNEDVNKEMY